MTDSSLHGVATLGTIAIAVVLGLVFTTVKMTNESDANKDNRFENAVTIEASLAFKKPDKKKKKQPQKQKKQMFKPADQKVSRDENADPVETKDEKKPRPDEIDPLEILKKNRELAEQDNASKTGEELDPDQGSADGSEWGTENEAKGDPYVGELKGRIYKAWTVPTFEKNQAVAVGCVKLEADGKIAERSLEKRSSNANLNASVEVALKNSTDMEDPVPAKLVDLLTKKGICFKFVLAAP